MPAQYQNPQCGPVTPDGDQGGFKLWQTDGVTIKDNYIHNNWGPGALGRHRECEYHLHGQRIYRQ